MGAGKITATLGAPLKHDAFSRRGPNAAIRKAWPGAEIEFGERRQIL
jgi:hypothetical protein